MLLVNSIGKMLWEETLLFIFTVLWCLFSPSFAFCPGKVKASMQGAFQCKEELFHTEFNLRKFIVNKLKTSSAHFISGVLFLHNVIDLAEKVEIKGKGSVFEHLSRV